MPSSRTGTANSPRRAGSEMRDASAKRTSVSVASASSLTLAADLADRQAEHRTGQQARRREEDRRRDDRRSSRPETAENASSSERDRRDRPGAHSSAPLRGNPHAYAGR